MTGQLTRRNFLVKLAAASSVSSVTGCIQSSKSEFPVKIRSPDGRITLSVKLFNGDLVYSISAFETEIIHESSLNLSLEGGHILPDDPSIIATQEKATRGGQNKTQESEMDENFNRLTIHVDKESEIKFRVYNYGIAFRYVLLGDGQTETINSELTEFSVSSDCQAWFPKSWGSQIKGPVSPSDLSAVSTPLTLYHNREPQYYLSIHEADLQEYAGMRISSTDGSRLATNLASKVRNKLPYQTPWRVILLTTEVGKLAEQDLIRHLNEPVAIDDTSWITRGKSVWDWRIRGESINDTTYRLNEKSLQRLIDFASANSIQFLTIDSGWYGDEHDPSTNPMTANKIDVQDIISYGRSNDVGTILYINDVAFDNHDTREILDTYSRWGAAGIKHGFLNSETQDAVGRVRNLLEETARRELHYTLHESYKPTGVRRTWPHFLTREYVQSLADGSPQSYATPEYFTLLPFVNLIGDASLDATPGYFSFGDQGDRHNIRGRIQSTIIGQLARCIIVRSDLLTLPDTPEAYEELSELFDFIQEIPDTPWDRSVIVNAEIGKFVIIARKSGRKWFVVGVTNSNSREISFSLDFLQDESYSATFFVDGENAHYLENPDEYVISHGKLRRAESLSLQMAPGGGFALSLYPEK